MSVRVRFAPSPTGHVHIGNIRVAIFNWLFARHEGGRFLLRIEDTDRERSTPEAIRTALDALEWLGIDYDEDPVYQSTRIDAHLAAAEQLLSKDLAYKEDKGGLGKGECVIFRMPGEDMSFHDEVKGRLHKAAADLKDFVIVRSDGSPVFHLANVVDDIHMGITHIIRGDDHIENTYRHVALFRALGAEVPAYAHLPMIVNRHGKPYSKRDGAAFVGEFRRQGYCPEALFNYLSLLGWSPGDDREKMTREEAVGFFALDRIKSHPAQMDILKLTDLNGQYIAELPIEEFADAARGVLERCEWWREPDRDYFMEVCRLMQSRAKVLTQAEEWKYYFTDDIDYEEKAVRKVLRRDVSRDGLEAAAEALSRVEFNENAIEQAIRSAERKAGMREGKLNQVLRVSVTGISRGAGIYETMALLGKERSLKRIEYAAGMLCGSVNG